MNEERAHNLSAEAVTSIIAEIAMAGSLAMEELLGEIDDDDIRRSAQMSALEFMTAMALTYWYGNDRTRIRQMCKESARSIPQLARDVDRLAASARDRGEL